MLSPFSLKVTGDIELRLIERKNTQELFEPIKRKRRENLRALTLMFSFYRFF